MGPKESLGSLYQVLGEFRYELRKFLRFSEAAARGAGLEPQQHQLLLAIKGLPPGRVPSIGTVAERMQLEHHSAVELVDRCVKRALVKRVRSKTDQRLVLLQVTPRGDKLLRELSYHHRDILREAAPKLAQVLSRLVTEARKDSKKAGQSS